MHFHLNPHTILPILVVPLSLSCGVFVLLQNPKAKLNQLFLAICSTFAAWFSFYIPYNFNYSPQLLIYWYKISYCFISFIPITCFTFVTTYLQASKNEFWFKVNSTIGVSFSILSITTVWIIKGVYYLPWFPYPRGGTLHPFLILHCIILAYLSIAIMVRALKNPHLSSQQKNHIKYMLSAIICLIFGASDFIGNYGVKFYGIGQFAVAGYLIITTIAIIKHHLMDIKIVFRRSLIYTVMIVLIALVYFLSIYLTEHMLEVALGRQSVFISLFFAATIAIAFIPIKNLLERYLFHKNLALVAEENELLRNEVSQTEKFKSVAALASSLAHEIKNPLTTLKVFSEHVLLKKDDPEFMQRYEKIVPREIDRINSLVYDLLEFAKPSSPQMQTVNPHKIIQNLLVLLEHKFKAANVNVVTRLNADTNIQADPNQLKQALLNLILNAIDAMPEGGTLTISTSSVILSPDDFCRGEESKGTLRSFVVPTKSVGTPQDDKYTITICDTGCGIAPQDLLHIFEPFYTKKEKGTGLGLSITQGIIEKHGGRIEVKSTVGKGTEFKIYLGQMRI